MIDCSTATAITIHEQMRISIQVSHGAVYIHQMPTMVRTMQIKQVADRI